MEQALSEVASSLQSSAPKQGPLHPWMTLAQIWLHAGTMKEKYFLFFPISFIANSVCDRKKKKVAAFYCKATCPLQLWQLLSSLLSGFIDVKDPVFVSECPLISSGFVTVTLLPGSGYRVSQYHK